MNSELRDVYETVISQVTVAIEELNDGHIETATGILMELVEDANDELNNL